MLTAVGVTPAPRPASPNQTRSPQLRSQEGVYEPPPLKWPNHSRKCTTVPQRRFAPPSSLPRAEGSPAPHRTPLPALCRGQTRLPRGVGALHPHPSHTVPNGRREAHSPTAPTAGTPNPAGGGRHLHPRPHSTVLGPIPAPRRPTPPHRAAQRRPGPARTSPPLRPLSAAPDPHLPQPHTARPRPRAMPPTSHSPTRPQQPLLAPPSARLSAPRSCPPRPRPGRGPAVPPRPPLLPLLPPDSGPAAAILPPPAPATASREATPPRHRPRGEGRRPRAAATTRDARVVGAAQSACARRVPRDEPWEAGVTQGACALAESARATGHVTRRARSKDSGGRVTCSPRSQ